MSNWQDWVGTSVSSTAWLDPQQANRMAVTLDREPSFNAGDHLPAAWHWLYFHDIVPASQLGGDGHPALGVTMPPVPLPRRMWAGGELAFRAPLTLGTPPPVWSPSDDRRETGPYRAVVLRDCGSRHPGRRPERGVGGPDDRLPRDVLPSQPQSRDRPRQADAEFQRTWELNNTALFRYSALTFNGHRIHYDADYARSVEGYPNLVIHGPLIATLLLDLAARNGRPLGTFRYTARSPLFLPVAFTVNGRPDGTSTKLWAASMDGRLAMQAQAFDREGTRHV